MLQNFSMPATEIGKIIMGKMCFVTRSTVNLSDTLLQEIDEETKGKTD